MKMTKWMKITLYSLAFFLYASGVMAWVLSQWFKVDEGFGAEPSPWAANSLHLHGILSLFFLVFFGVIFESHVKKGWKAKRKIKSGLLLISPLILVMLTVPGLYYLNDGWLKVTATQIHTFIGLALILPALIHPLTQIKKKRRFLRDE